MIIWGTKGQEKEIGTGRFYCPRCDGEKPYTRKKVSKYFTLFFLPLFEISKIGEFIQCSACNTTFKPEVLDLKPLSTEQRALLQVKGDLATGTPFQMVEKKLINSGFDSDKAAMIIDQAIPDQIRECVNCQLAYVAAVDKCSNCGEELSQPFNKPMDNLND